MQEQQALAEWLQRALVNLADDWESLASFSSGFADDLPISGDARWQFGVDMIYRFIKSGLGRVALSDYTDENSFFLALRTLNPFDSGDGGLFWNSTFLEATNELVTLLRKHDDVPWANTTSMNTALIAELLAVFVKNGVSLEKSSLLPIKPA